MLLFRLLCRYGFCPTCRPRHYILSSLLFQFPPRSLLSFWKSKWHLVLHSFSEPKFWCVFSNKTSRPHFTLRSIWMGRFWSPATLRLIYVYLGSVHHNHHKQNSYYTHIPNHNQEYLKYWRQKPTRTQARAQTSILKALQEGDTLVCRRSWWLWMGCWYCLWEQWFFGAGGWSRNWSLEYWGHWLMASQSANSEDIERLCALSFLILLHHGFQYMDSQCRCLWETLGNILHRKVQSITP